MLEVDGSITQKFLTLKFANEFNTNSVETRVDRITYKVHVYFFR